MPRVSRPALPASLRKQGVCAVSRMGSCDSASTSSRTKLVSDTSLVGIRYSACCSSDASPSWPPLLTANRSASNLGSWPVPRSVASLTM